MNEIEWKKTAAPVPYEEGIEAMESRVEAIRSGSKGGQVWLLEHPSLYTAGTSAKPSDLLDNGGFPVYETGRGGEFTYHGPGQRVAYVMLDLKEWEPDIKRYVWKLEEWIIRTIAHFGIEGERREGRVGIWVVTPKGEDKIAAIGIRVRKWVSFHGIAINVNPDLSHFKGIVPCGIREHGVTSLHALGKKIGMNELDAALKEEFEAVFG